MPPAVDTAIIFTANMVELAAFYQEAFELEDPAEQDRHRGFQLDGLYLRIDQTDDQGDLSGCVEKWIQQRGLIGPDCGASGQMEEAIAGERQLRKDQEIDALVTRAFHPGQMELYVRLEVSEANVCLG